MKRGTKFPLILTACIHFQIFFQNPYYESQSPIPKISHDAKNPFCLVGHAFYCFLFQQIAFLRTWLYTALKPCSSSWQDHNIFIFYSKTFIKKLKYVRQCTKFHYHPEAQASQIPIFVPNLSSKLLTQLPNCPTAYSACPHGCLKRQIYDSRTRVTFLQPSLLQCSYCNSASLKIWSQSWHLPFPIPSMNASIHHHLHTVDFACKTSLTYISTTKNLFSHSSRSPQVQDQGSSQFSAGESSPPGLQTATLISCCHMAFPWCMCVRLEQGAGWGASFLVWH